MKFKPLSVKFSDDRLNNKVKIPETSVPFCEKHTVINDLVYHGNQIFCKKCGSKLAIVPNWIVNLQ